MIFNTIGSNYGYKTAVAIKKWQGNGEESKKDLIGTIEKHFNNDFDCYLFYKAREACEAVLKALNLPKDAKIGITGLTCLVLEKAILRAGLTPVFIDVAPNSLNFDLGNLKRINRNGDIKILLLQNTLGSEMEELDEVVNYCKKNKIIIFEDLAHNFGMTYSNGEEAGTIGDIGIISFSRDKGCDAVSGGALIVRKSAFLKRVYDNLKEINKNKSHVSKRQAAIDKKYPIRAFWVRKLYPITLGKALHRFYQNRGLLLSVMVYGGENKINDITDMSAGVANDFISSGKFEIARSHRCRVALLYHRNLPKELQIPDITAPKIKNGTMLRFPILLKSEQERTRLIKFFQKHGIENGDIWFNAVSAPKRLAYLSDYKIGDCPNGDDISNRLLNLPVHQEITEGKAKKIIGIVYDFLQK